MIIKRTGNLIELGGGASLLPGIAKELSYSHKTFYRGPELRSRFKWKEQQLHEKMLGNPYNSDADNFNANLDFTNVACYHATPGGGLATPAGLYHRMTKYLNSKGIQHTFQDLRRKQLPPADFMRLVEHPDLINFKYKQDMCLATIDAATGGVVKCPTGYGKSFMAVLCAIVWPKSRICFITPGLDTLKGLAKRLNAAGITDVGIVGAGSNRPDCRVTLASADSLHKVFLSKQDLILYDEVHTCSGKKVKYLSRFSEAKFIGFSATYPGRSDGTDFVIEGMFGPIIIDVSYQEAVANNAVTQIRVLALEIPPWGSYQNDYTGEAWKRHAFWRNDVRNWVLAESIRSLVPTQLKSTDPQILCMVETIDHAFELRRFLPDFTLVYKEPSKADWNTRKSKLVNRGLMKPDELPCTDEDRDTFRKQFETGQLRRVISTYVFKQGVDFTGLEVFVRCDGNDTSTLNGQMPGRLSRLHDGKEYGLLIDTVDRFDPGAERRSMGRLNDYRKYGWDIRKVKVQIVPPSLSGSPSVSFTV